MEIDRRNFFKVTGGVVASLFVPAKLRAVIPVEKESLTPKMFIWTADEDWGIISYVGAFDKYDNLLHMSPVTHPQDVSKGDQVTLTLDLTGDRAIVQYIGLFNDTADEVSSKGYSRIKTWFLKLVKG